MQPRRFAAASIVVSLLLAILLEPGCARLHAPSAQGAKAGAKLYAVTADLTAFYRYSPRQAGGPDKRIPRDTPVKLIRGSPTFCKIELLSGEKGFVANDDIRPAPANLLASNSAAEKPATNSSEWRAEIPEPRSSAPEPPLPEFEPTPIVVPPGPGN
jgi:hypothetical protein